jgi:hypothetical protein
MRIARRLLRRFILLSLFLLILIRSEPPPAAPLPLPDDPPVESVSAPLETLCADLGTAWGQDWARVIAILKTVHARQAQCGNQDPYLQLYPAYYNYGAWLEARGNLQEALTAYQLALTIQPEGREAALALKKYNSLAPLPLPTCTISQINQAQAAIPPYLPQSGGDFARLQDGRLYVGGQPFAVRGVNYYPVRAPWRRFLTDSDLETVAREMDLIQGARLNTLRIFVWYGALFDCSGSGAVPNAAAFARLDGIIRLAAAHHFRLIVTLNDLPDVLVRPLYRYPEAASEQTAYVVRRYRDEPVILAWDLRNEGDIDYGRGYVTSKAVLSWLNTLSVQVRVIDPNHLITAGWNENSYVTDSAVDFLSFHHWRSADNLRDRIDDLRAHSQKPILLEEVGYSTPATSLEARQAQSLRDAVTMADAQNLLGWVVWTAFDFPTDVTCIPPACPSQDNSEHHFGLWRTDYTPKPALDTLENLITP